MGAELAAVDYKAPGFFSVLRKALGSMCTHSSVALYAQQKGGQGVIGALEANRSVNKFSMFMCTEGWTRRRFLGVSVSIVTLENVIAFILEKLAADTRPAKTFRSTSGSGATSPGVADWL